MGSSMRSSYSSGTHPLLFYILEAGRLRNPVTGPAEELVVERVEDRPRAAGGDGGAHHGIRFELRAYPPRP